METIGRVLDEGLGPRVEGLPEPQVTYRFRDTYKDTRTRNPKNVGSLGSR